MASLNNAINMSQISTVKVQIFTVGTSTYTPSPGLINCTVEISAGGGGGGGSTGVAGQSGSSAGGGGGGYCRKTYTAALIGANATVVVGALGAAGTAGNNPGTAGSNSTFTPAGAGAILTASGGGGGGGGTATATVGSSSAAGAGGAATNGDINIPGGNGDIGIVLLGSSGICGGGAGGNSFFGGVTNNIQPTARTAGANYGTGGSGVRNTSGADAVGSDGGNGFCIITEYCNQ